MARGAGEIVIIILATCAIAALWLKRKDNAAPINRGEMKRALNAGGIVLGRAPSGGQIIAQNPQAGLQALRDTRPAASGSAP